MLLMLDPQRTPGIFYNISRHLIPSATMFYWKSETIDNKGNSLSFFTSYLKGIVQMVNAAGYSDRLIKHFFILTLLNMGVFQGSTLGWSLSPTIFFIYVFDMPNRMGNDLLFQYADDTTLMNPIYKIYQ